MCCWPSAANLDEKHRFSGSPVYIWAQSKPYKHLMCGFVCETCSDHQVPLGDNVKGLGSCQMFFQSSVMCFSFGLLFSVVFISYFPYFTFHIMIISDGH